MELTTAEPVRPAHIGDATAEPFEAFCRAHVDRVHRALALTLRNNDLAREATDEAMARACARWDRLHAFDNPAATSASPTPVTAWRGRAGAARRLSLS